MMQNCVAKVFTQITAQTKHLQTHDITFKVNARKVNIAQKYCLQYVKLLRIY